MTRATILLSIISVVIIQSNANADLVFSQSPPIDQFGINSNLGGPSSQQIADDFILAASSTINSVVWWGAYDAATVPPGNTQFTIRFFEDAGGISQTSPINEYLVQPAIVTDLAINGQAVLRFSAAIPSTQFSPNQTHWISILDSDNSTLQNFRWSNLWFGRISARVADGSPWLGFNNFGMAFELHGITAVPEPSALVMVFAGIGAALGWRLRRPVCKVA